MKNKEKKVVRVYFSACEVRWVWLWLQKPCFPSILLHKSLAAARAAVLRRYAAANFFVVNEALALTAGAAAAKGLVTKGVVTIGGTAGAAPLSAVAKLGLTTMMRFLGAANVMVRVATFPHVIFAKTPVDAKHQLMQNTS